MKRLKYIFLSLGLILMASTGSNLAQADRLKDIVDVSGSRPNQLVGYGIIVGLNGTGDGSKAEFTIQSVAAMLRRLGVRVDPSRIKIKNAAAVMVTAQIPAFSRAGQQMDVLVSSMGDAKSLRGGTLIQTPLLGADRKVYAVAQGPISVGGFSAGGSGASKTSGHPTVGRVPHGAIIEREIPSEIVFENNLNLTLKRPDSKTATSAVSAINKALGGSYAKAEDPGRITVTSPEAMKGKSVELLAAIGDIEIQQDAMAKIIINERSGTVVVGSAVRLRPAAIAHGGLTVEIKERTLINQPETPFGGGQTVISEDTTVDADMAPGDLHLIPTAATVGELVNALNTLGVKPSDLIIIFQSLSAAGALTADIEVQ